CPTNARSASKSIRRFVLGNPIIRGTSRYPARARSRASIRQLVEQRLGLFQIERLEAFGEPAVDRSEKIASLIPWAIRGLPGKRSPDQRGQFDQIEDGCCQSDDGGNGCC